MSDLLMRGRILRTLAMGLRPLLEPLSVADSSAARIAAPTTRATHTRPQRRWQPSNETALTSIQAGRGPPCRSSAHVVRDSSFATH